MGEGGRKRATAMWYLVGLPSYKNLREALEGCLARHLAAKRKTQMQEPLEECAPLGQAPRSVRRSPKVERQQLVYREERLARYEQVVALRERWESGCHNMVRLHQELVERGYKGSYASVRDHIIRRLPRSARRTGPMGVNLHQLLCRLGKQPSCSCGDLKSRRQKSKRQFKS